MKEAKVPKEFIKSPQFYIEDLEEILIRLHTALIGWEEKNDGFKELLRKMEKRGFSITKQKDKESFKDYQQYRYYQGKFYAYYYVLENFGSNLIPVIKRLRGIKFKGNKVIEEKVYRTEKIGHQIKNGKEDKDSK